jgi:hypothetical protein
MQNSTEESLGAEAREAKHSCPLSSRRRRISPDAGRALEILGHAIEYLADEYVHEGKSLSASDPQVRAMQILMALNRQIYFECPVVPTLSERLRKFLRVS